MNESPLRGRWAYRKRKHGKPLLAHLISSEGKAFCGRILNHGEVMEACWNPDEHENICSGCLEWYRACIKHPERPSTTP